LNIIVSERWVSRIHPFGRSAEDFLSSRGMGLRGGLTVDAPPFKLGARVVHARFGEDVVLGYEGAGAHLVVMVNFAEAGMKRLVVAYAGLSAA
jgi:hypothetical protein